MNRLLGFGKRALFTIRVISGYEEWRIRSSRLRIQQILQQAQERRNFRLKLIPEQVILLEFRRLVNSMKELDLALQHTELAIEKYFTPFDRRSAAILTMQMLREENNAQEMMRIAQKQTVPHIAIGRKDEHT